MIGGLEAVLVSVIIWSAFSMLIAVLHLDTMVASDFGLDADFAIVSLGVCNRGVARRYFKR